MSGDPCEKHGSFTNLSRKQGNVSNQLIRNYYCYFKISTLDS